MKQPIVSTKGFPLLWGGLAYNKLMIFVFLKTREDGRWKFGSVSEEVTLGMSAVAHVCINRPYNKDYIPIFADSLSIIRKLAEPSHLVRSPHVHRSSASTAKHDASATDHRVNFISLSPHTLLMIISKIMLCFTNSTSLCSIQHHSKIQSYNVIFSSG